MVEALHRGHHAHPHLDVLLHESPLSFVERTPLLQNGIGRSRLSDIVEEGGVLDDADLLLP
jgi:hypothetical protein